MSNSTDEPVAKRRTILGAVGSIAALGFTTGVSGRSPPNEDGYVLQQGETCVSITPLSGDRPVEELYDWGTGRQQYSSAGTVDLQRPATSILFLYEGPNGMSLVMVHGNYQAQESPGGSVSFDFAGLPTDGEWAVQDDYYDASTNYDNWSHDESSASVDWTWGQTRTDGGAFRGLGGDPMLEISIDPRFNEQAALYGDYYNGEVAEWQLVSGQRDFPERVSLALDEQITIKRGICEMETVTEVIDEKTVNKKAPDEETLDEKTPDEREDDDRKHHDDDRKDKDDDKDRRKGRGRGRGRGKGHGRGRGRGKGRGEDGGGDDDDSGSISIEISASAGIE